MRKKWPQKIVDNFFSREGNAILYKKGTGERAALTSRDCRTIAVLNGNGLLEVLYETKENEGVPRKCSATRVAAFTGGRFLKKISRKTNRLFRWFVRAAHSRIMRSMDLHNDQNQNLDTMPEPVSDNFWTARFVKFLGVFLAIIGLVSGGYWIWFNYFSATAKMQANVERYEDWQAQYDKAMREDTYGGKTPQETLNMFIDALKKGDIELASKYFALDENLGVEKWKKFLADIAKQGNLIRFASDLERYDEAKKTFDPYFVFVYYNSDGTIGLQLTLIFNSEAKIWKIESL